MHCGVMEKKDRSPCDSCRGKGTSYTLEVWEIEHTPRSEKTFKVGRVGESQGERIYWGRQGRTASNGKRLGVLEKKRGLEARTCPGGTFQGWNVYRACEAPRSTRAGRGRGAEALMQEMLDLHYDNYQSIE